jgi:uncharacterized protein involved in cysteine biosynthesis
VITALGRSLAQLGDGKVLGVLLKTLLLTLALLVALWFALDRWLARSGPPRLPAWLQPVWIELSDWAALPLVLVAGWFLFPAIATGVMGLFLDDVVDAVEARHFAQAPPTRRVGWGEGALLALASALRLLAWNLALAPLYLLLLFTAIGPALLFMVLNGWLMGRDLMEMVAIRHMPAAATKAFVSAAKPTRIALGATAAPLFLVPGINLLAPILSAALATHAFHAACRQLGKRP